MWVITWAASFGAFAASGLVLALLSRQHRRLFLSQAFLGCAFLYGAISADLRPTDRFQPGRPIIGSVSGMFIFVFGVTAAVRAAKDRDGGSIWSNGAIALGTAGVFLALGAGVLLSGWYWGLVPLTIGMALGLIAAHLLWSVEA